MVRSVASKYSKTEIRSFTRTEIDHYLRTAWIKLDRCYSVVVDRIFEFTFALVVETIIFRRRNGNSSVTLLENAAEISHRLGRATVVDGNSRR